MFWKFPICWDLFQAITTYLATRIKAITLLKYNKHCWITVKLLQAANSWQKLCEVLKKVHFLCSVFWICHQLVTMPTFGPISEYKSDQNWEEYVEQVQFFFGANGIDDEDKKRQIFSPLSGEKHFT